MLEPNELDTYVGGRIRNIREFRGISRDALASVFEMTSTEVGHIELGLKRPSAEQIVTIAGVLRVRPSFFFSKLPLSAEVEHASSLVPLYEELVGKLTQGLWH